ncbi:MAG: GAF domain-containing protein [Chloroflexota bacterium]
MDAISENLEAECGWVQLERGGKLHLVSSRNFTREMRREITRTDMARHTEQEVLGLGKQIIVPDLSRNGHHGLSAFSAAGFRSLIAVPIMTYRVLGVLGAGFRSKKDFRGDLPPLFTTIAGMVGMALKRSDYSVPEGPVPPGDDTPQKDGERPDRENSAPADDTEHFPGAFREHVHRMATFRKAHL